MLFRSGIDLGGRQHAVDQADFERRHPGRLTLITQNVDTLHDQAGSQDVIELHGSLHRVLCLDCHRHSPRDVIQRQMEVDNPHMAQVHAVQAPDGDTLLDPAFEQRFQVPHCPHCNGERLKPDVVFFGETVPRERVQTCMAAVARADAVLIAGSSLMVYSGYRFALAAHEQGKSVVAINQGVTRADALLDFKLEADVGQVLMGLVEAS